MKWLKKWWWTIVAGVALVAGFIFGGFLKGKKKDDDQPSFADMAKEEAAVIEEQINAEKAKAKAETEAQMAELTEIERMKNDEERRKKLAEFLEGL